MSNKESTWKVGALGFAVDPFPPGLMHIPTDLGTFEVQSDEWLDVRRRGIGASDVASILGIPGAFSSPLEIWAQKIGEGYSRKIDDALNEMFHFGNKMEPLIAEELVERTGYEVRPEPRTLAHPVTSFVQANLDSWVCVDGVWCPGEFKNATAYTLDQWLQEPPLKYQVQVQAQMYVTGAPMAVMAALVGGCRFLWTTVERNDEFIAAMVRRLTLFWQMVMDNERPRACELDIDLLKSLTETDDELAIVLPFEAIHWAAQRIGFKEEIKDTQKEVREVDAKIWEALGEAATGELPDNSGQFKVSTNKNGTKSLRYRSLK